MTKRSTPYQRGYEAGQEARAQGKPVPPAVMRSHSSYANGFRAGNANRPRAKPGRPKKGRQFSVTLNEESIALAYDLGRGNVAEGVRRVFEAYQASLNKDQT